MRKPLQKAEGQLAATFREAMRVREQMRADGATEAELERSMAIAIRSAWPEVHTWHYGCEACRDTGWREGICHNGSCGRPFKLPQQALNDHTGRGRCVEGHEFAFPCFCLIGQKHRNRLLRERTEADALAVAARVTKPSRIGR